jgi:hypothetical protein
MSRRLLIFDSHQALMNIPLPLITIMSDLVTFDP